MSMQPIRIIILVLQILRTFRGAEEVTNCLRHSALIVFLLWKVVDGVSAKIPPALTS